MITEDEQLNKVIVPDIIELPKLKCNLCLILEPHKEHTWTPSLEYGNIGGSLALCSGFKRKRRFLR